MSITWDTEQVRIALRARHGFTEGMRGQLRSVLLEEVRNATGFDANRACDAIALSFWPSDGLKVIGYEIKVSRSDWLRELKAPEKAFAFARYCDAWWIAAGAADIVKEDELPPNWGLLVPNAKGKLHPVRGATHVTPEPMSRAMIMALVRTACMSTWEPQVNALRETATREATARAESDRRQLQRDFDELQKRVDAFEKASGVEIGTQWSGESPQRIGGIVRAVKGVLNNGYGGALMTVTGHANVLRALVAQCDAAVEEIQRLQTEDRKGVVTT